jgi:tRNA U34 5-methylaminomethyl-2-thiouridine-forming methyltransferase MnmC
MAGENFFNREIVTTADGSSSIYLPAFDEHYHSSHGAIQESMHVFVAKGWQPVAARQHEISILEIGFGTGLNAWLILRECEKDPAKKVAFTSLEAYPVSAEDAVKLNYAPAGAQEKFLKLHEAEWGSGAQLTPNFSLLKLQTTLQDFASAAEAFDLIFFDAFSPKIQPELWTEEIFAKMFHAMKPGGILVTYCAKGEVRRNMQKAGFKVERLPGPPGKREMLRAVKVATDFADCTD